MKNHKFNAAFGILTMAFSRMEGYLRILISGVAFGENNIVASAFLDNSQLGGNLRILRKIARQYWKREKDFIDIITLIESIRKKRNLFIHGKWYTGDFGEADGSASVTDLRTEYKVDETSRSWSHTQTQHFSMSDFQEILVIVNSAISKIHQLYANLENEEGIEFGEGGGTAMLKPESVNIGPDELTGNGAEQ